MIKDPFYIHLGLSQLSYNRDNMIEAPFNRAKTKSVGIQGRKHDRRPLWYRPKTVSRPTGQITW